MASEIEVCRQNRRVDSNNTPDFNSFVPNQKVFNGGFDNTSLGVSAQFNLYTGKNGGIPVQEHDKYIEDNR